MSITRVNSLTKKKDDNHHEYLSIIPNVYDLNHVDQMNNKHQENCEFKKSNMLSNDNHHSQRGLCLNELIPTIDGHDNNDANNHNEYHRLNTYNQKKDGTPELQQVKANYYTPQNSNQRAKFYLNNSLKSFHLKNGLKINNPNDSYLIKSSPSMANSNLPTDVPSIKLLTGRSKGIPSIDNRKIKPGSKDKVFKIKYDFTVNDNNFYDYKALNQYKSTVESYSKFVASLKYPYYFVDFHDNSELIDLEKNNYLTNSVSKDEKSKTFAKWKEEMKKKVELKKKKA